MTDADSRSLYKAVCRATKTDYHASAYEDFILDCTTEMGKLGLEIRTRVNETTGKQAIGLVSEIVALSAIRGRRSTKYFSLFTGVLIGQYQIRRDFATSFDSHGS